MAFSLPLTRVVVSRFPARVLIYGLIEGEEHRLFVRDTSEGQSFVESLGIPKEMVTTYEYLPGSAEFEKQLWKLFYGLSWDKRLRVSENLDITLDAGSVSITQWFHEILKVCKEANRVEDLWNVVEGLHVSETESHTRL